MKIFRLPPSVFPMFAAVALASCSSGSTPTTSPTSQSTGAVSTVSLRAVQGSPDAGPVDVYIYATTGSQPGTPIITNLQYPGISQYYVFPVGSYAVSVDAAGTKTQLATEIVGGTTANAQLTIAFAGRTATATLQLQNFIEPAETAGTAALIVHHASPAVNLTLSPVGVGVYTATAAAAPVPSATSQLFSFALASATTGSFPSSGPATTGMVSSGEYFLAPLPSTLSSPLGFAAGAPGATTLASVVASTTLSGLAAALDPAGAGLTPPEQTLAQTTSNVLPPGAHLSIFAVDSIASAPGILIGTLDP